MKSKLIFFFVFISILSYSQTPDLVNYQAVIRGFDGQILSNLQIGFQLSIIKGSPIGSTVYQEVHDITTNNFGQIAIQIGRGTSTNGDFSSINWGNDEYYIETALHNEEQGGGYVTMGTSQLVSVPYALNSKRTESFILTDLNGEEYELWVDTLGNIGTYPIYENGAPCTGIPYISYLGQIYYTIQVGNKCWLRENLNVGTMINAIEDMQDNGTLEKYCHENITENCDTFGGLYQWDEMMQYITQEGVQGICPEGWHIPTDAEWKTLEGNVDSQYPVGDPVWDNLGWRGFDAGKALRNTSGWNFNGNGTNTFGFSALPGGNRHISGVFNGFGDYCLWWSSSEGLDIDEKLGRALRYNYDEVNRVSPDKMAGFSIRCIKDNSTANQPPDQLSNPQPENGAIDTEVNAILSWSCSDPENDPLLYDVYFGTEATPPQVSTDQTEVNYNPGTLDYSTEYFWMVVAHDQFNATEGQTWSFTTVGPPTNGLVASYPFAGNANDESVNGFHLTENGAILTDDRFGSPNNAYYFDGSNSDLVDNIGYPGFELTGSISFALWIKPDNVTPSENMGIAGKGNSTTRNYDFYITTDSKAAFIVEGLNNAVVLSNTILQVGEWYYLVGVYEYDQNLKLYINGSFETDVPFTGMPTSSVSKFAIGCQGENSCTDFMVSFEGKIDDVRLYNMALTAQEIQALYNY